jgi:ribulose 1,5-bisphosphate carboxylase large subunit-like protein
MEYLTMNQKERLMAAFSEGQQLTAKQIANQFKIGSPSKVVSLLRSEGNPIYLNRHVDTRGRVTHKYRLGTPRRSLIARAVRMVGADRAFA